MTKEVINNFLIILPIHNITPDLDKFHLIHICVSLNLICGLSNKKKIIYHVGGMRLEGRSHQEW